MRRTLAWLLLALIPAAVLASVPESYYLVLRDGSWVRAAEKPTVEEGIARVRLPNGLLALIEAERIDWRQSDDRSRKMAAIEIAGETVPTNEPAPKPKEPMPGTLTIVNAPTEAEKAGEAAPEQAAPPLPDAQSQAASLRARISTLDSGIAELQGRKRDLELQADGSYNLDEAEKLRKQAGDVDNQIQRLRAEKERLLRQLWNIQQP